MSEPKYPNHPCTKAADKDAVARAYARMDEETAAFLRGDEVNADRTLNDAREGKPADLGSSAPKSVELDSAATDEQTGLPGDPHDDPEYDPLGDEEHGRALGPEEMCRAWGRVESRFWGIADRSSSPRLRSAKSQLLVTKSIATHLASLAGENDRAPTMDEQTAWAVEATPGFVDALNALTDNYARAVVSDAEPSEEVVAFHVAIRREWPNGFRPSRWESLTRGEQVKVIERDVHRQQRRSGRRPIWECRGGS